MKNVVMESNLILEKTFKHAILSRVSENPDILIVEATTSYIPIEEFNFDKELFK